MSAPTFDDPPSIKIADVLEIQPSSRIVASPNANRPDVSYAGNWSMRPPDGFPRSCDCNAHTRFGPDVNGLIGAPDASRSISMPTITRCGNAPSSPATTMSNFVLLIRVCIRITDVDNSGCGSPFASGLHRNSTTGTRPNGFTPPGNSGSTSQSVDACGAPVRDAVRYHDWTSPGVHTVTKSYPSSLYHFNAARRSYVDPGAYATITWSASSTVTDTPVSVGHT